MATNLPIPHLEQKTYILHEVKVLVEIDYDKGTISLLESRNNPKKWVFALRTIEYMQGWRNIIEAMTFAITEAEKCLQKFQDAEEKRKVQFMKNVLKD